MSTAKKDGVVWLRKKDGGFVISTLIPGTIDLGAMSSLQHHLQKAGFEEDDRVSLHYMAAGVLQVDITLSSVDVTLLQVELCLKNFVSCLKDSRVIRRPMISRINDRISRSFHGR